MLYYKIKALQNLIYNQFCLSLERSKKEIPCFHKPVSIQINSPLLQGVTQPISELSDVALHNQGPPKTHILPVQPVILNSSKKETPCLHRPV